MAMAIPIGKYGWAWVDAVDHVLVSDFAWYGHKARNTVYARAEFMIDGRRHRVYMHRLILGLRLGDEVDHIDGDGLNNRRSNLRRATHSENMRNRRKHYYSPTSPYKGVQARGGNWVAIIRCAGKYQVIGVFADPMVAARAYDDAARRLHGEFAKLNFG